MWSIVKDTGQKIKIWWQKIRREVSAVVIDRYELKVGWDSFPLPDSNKKSFFSGRKDLVDRVSHWVSDGQGGSYLISGVRGVGKTAFVYHSINKARKAKWYLVDELFGFGTWFRRTLQRIPFFEFQTLIFVPVNASQCVSEDKEFLKEIIKRCHYSFETDQSQKLYESAVIGTTEEVRGRSGEVEVDLKLSTFVKVPMFWIFVLIYWVFSSHIDPLLPKYPLVINNLSFLLRFDFLAKILLLVVIISGFFGVKRKVSDKVEQKINSDDPNYLFHKLRELLEDRSRRGITHIFVVDETDKTGVDLDSLVMRIKNLITISSGKFIFISADDYYRKLKSKITDNDSHPISSTFFTSTIFLPVIEVKEIKFFLEQITGSVPVDDTLECFAYYLYSECGGVFVEIKNSIRNFIYFESGKQILSLNIDKFNVNNRRAARLTKVLLRVHRVYDSTRKSSPEWINYRREALLPILKSLICGEGISGSLDSILKRNEGRGYQYLTEVEKQLLRNELREFLVDVKRFANKDEELSNVIPDISEADAEIQSFKVDPSQISDGIADLRDSREHYNSSEENLIDVVEKLSIKLGAYAKCLSVSVEKLLGYFGVEYYPEYNSAVSFVSSMSLDKYAPQDEVLAITNLIGKIHDLLDTRKSEILSKYFSELYFDWIDTNHKLDGKEAKVAVASLKGVVSDDWYQIFGKNGKPVILCYSENNVDRINVQGQIFGKQPSIPLPKNYELWFFVNKGNKNAIDFSKKYKRLDVVSLENMFPNITELKKKIKEVFQINGEGVILEDWESRSRDMEVTQRFDKYQIPVPVGMRLKQTRLNFSCTSNRWRFGVVMGGSDKDLAPLSGNHHTLFHLYKDEGSDQIKYLNFPRLGILSRLDKINKDLGVDLKSNFELILKRDSKNKKNMLICVNGIVVDSLEVRNIDLENVFLLAWADGSNFEASVKNIVCQFSKK